MLPGSTFFPNNTVDVIIMAPAIPIIAAPTIRLILFFYFYQQWLLAGQELVFFLSLENTYIWRNCFLRDGSLGINWDTTITCLVGHNSKYVSKYLKNCQNEKRKIRRTSKEVCIS